MHLEYQPHIFMYRKKKLNSLTFKNINITFYKKLHSR